MTTLKRETGYTEVALVDGTGSYHLPIEAYEDVLQRWMAGAAFLTVTGYFGEQLVIKGARIEAVMRLTPESIELDRAHKAALKSEDAITGDA
jgi:hypothetical protein